MASGGVRQNVTQISESRRRMTVEIATKQPDIVRERLPRRV